MRNHSVLKHGNRKHLLLATKIVIGLLVSLIVVGSYLGLLLLSPQLLPKLSNSWNKTPSIKSVYSENRLYIPKLKLNLAYNSGGAEVLNLGAWHRFPERGNPEKGGNFILAGHRFKIGTTPKATKDSSPFYRFNLLSAGDKIYVDFKGIRYEYVVNKNYSVAPTQINIEAPSLVPKMTLYTCTLKGSSDGREVVEATQIAKNVDTIQE